MAFLWIDSAARITSNLTLSNTPRNVRQIDGVSPRTREKDFSEEMVEELNNKKFNSSSAKLAYEQAATILKSSRINLLASDVMTSPVETLKTSQNILDATTFFIKHRFRHVPIVNNDKRLVGILSDRDIYKYYHEHTQAGDTDTPSISNVAVSPVLTTSLETPIKDVVRTLFEQKIGAMPVLDKDNNLTGIITRSDILRVILEKTHFDLFV
jgi:CBS domain-containing protein